MAQPDFITAAKLRLDRELGSELDDWSLVADYDLPWAIDGIDGESDWLAEDMRRMLRRDGKSQTLERVLTLPIRSAPWAIEPSDEGGMNVRAQNKMIEEIRHMLDHMEEPLSEIIGLMTGAYIYKRAFFEKVYTRIDNRIGYQRIAWRPQTTCSVIRDKKKNGRITGFRQRRVDSDGFDDHKILMPYAFIYTHGTATDPVHGISDFEVAYNAYVTKEKIKYLWYNFLEGQALPRTIVRGQNKEGVKRAVQAIAQLKNSGIAGIPADWAESITPLDTSGKGSAEFKAALDWLDREAAGSVLAGFTDLTKGDSAQGSYALSKDQTDFFLQMQQGNAVEGANALRKGVLTDIVKLNWGQKAVVPKVRIGPLQREDIEKAAEMLQSFATAGPELRVPQEFVEELTVKVCEALELDLDKIIKAQKELAEDIKNAGTMTDEDFAGIQAGVDALMNGATQATGGLTQASQGLGEGPALGGMPAARVPGGGDPSGRGVTT